MNIERILYQKSKWVIYGLVAFASLIVFMSIRNSVQAYSTYARLQQDLELTASLPQVGQAKYPAEMFEKVDLNKIIFEAIGEAAKLNGVIVKKIGAPHFQDEDKYTVLTAEVTLAGDMIKVMQCMDLADAELGLVKIASLKFEREELAKANTLSLKAYFQFVKTKQDAP